MRTREAAQALARLPRKPKFPELACAPAFVPYNDRRLEWQKQRMYELATAHGSVSRGVGAMINSAAWLYAAAEYAAAQAATTGNVELFKSVAQLTGQARQLELTAWELGSREAATKPKGDADSLDAFWAKGMS